MRDVAAAPSLVGYIDIDEFKAVNDRLGHKAGDRLLIEIARRIKAVLRTDDTLARLGGDEFALLLNDISGPGECHESLSRLMNELARPFALGEGSPVMVSASVGAVLYQGHSTSADELVRCADQAMYRAKELGRNRIELFHGPSTQKGVDRENTLTRIERALADGELQLYYQPRVDMRRGIVVGAEALIRWIHPTRGVIPPGEFLPVVEGTDFVGILGDWVIDSALTQLEAWRTAGLELSVSVNISPDHLQAQGFADRLAEHLVAHATVPPACLELEVLESPRLEDIGYIDSVIADCRASEVRFALDDFGTGFSSLAYLKGIPADVLKIDQSFVADSSPTAMTWHWWRRSSVWLITSTSRLSPRGWRPSSMVRCCCALVAAWHRALVSHARCRLASSQNGWLAFQRIAAGVMSRSATGMSIGCLW